MTAEISNRLEPTRTQLQDVIPLATPYVLIVDPSSLCNQMCHFCPSGDKELIRKTGRYQGIVDIEVFKKLIDDLSDFPEPVRVLRLYKEGEPLLNPRLPEMIRYAKGKVQKIDLTTNGTLLKNRLVNELVDAGLDRINISINSVEDLELIKNIEYLYQNKGQCEIYIKAIEEHLSNVERKRFFWIYEKMCDKIFLEHLQPNWPEFEFAMSEPITGHYGQVVEDRNVCPFIFYQMVVNSDGSVSACVQDWKHTLLFGNVMKRSVKDIWDTIDRFRILHLEGGRKKLPFCKDCSVMRYGCLDNIDAYASELLERLL